MSASGQKAKSATVTIESDRGPNSDMIDAVARFKTEHGDFN
jgi:hypothetical protein